MAELEDDLELDKAVAFAILMGHGDGLKAKSPKYVMEKWLWVQGCASRMEAISILNVFGQRIFFQWRDLWFKENHADSWPFDTIPPEGACSSTTNEDEKQEATPTLRYIECDQHTPRIYCYVQDDGTHLQRDSCICGFSENPDCPFDLHRYYAGKGFTGESRLEI